MHKLLRMLSVSVIVLSPLVAVSSVFAAPSATMSLSPASGNEVNGTNLTVGIYEDSGSEPVNGAVANISYSSNLSCDGVSPVGGNSVWNIAASTSCSGGTVNVQRGALPAVTGSQLIATVNFTVTASSGTATLTFSGTNDIVDANTNSNILAGSSGASFSLSAPAAPAPTPTPTPTPTKTTTTPTKTTTTTPTKTTTPTTTTTAPSATSSTTPPVITNVTVSNVGTNSATISWTTSESATSEVDYGLNSDYGFTAGNSDLVTTHSVVLDPALLTPGTEFHFVVKSTNSSGNTATGQDLTFTTTGLTVVVTVVDQHKKPVHGAQVIIGSVSGTTNNNGQVTLSGLQAGKTATVVKYKGTKTSSSVDVTSTTSSTPQSVTLPIKVSSSNTLLVLLILLILIAIVAAAAVVEGNKFRNFKFPGKGPKGDGGSSSGSSNNPLAPPPAVFKPTIPPRI